MRLPNNTPLSPLDALFCWLWWGDCCNLVDFKDRGGHYCKETKWQLMLHIMSFGLCRAKLYCSSSADLALPEYTALIQSLLYLTVFFVSIFDFALRRIFQHPIIGAQCHYNRIGLVIAITNSNQSG